MPRIDPAAIHHILIRSANWIGDGVMSLPALEAVRRAFPGADITLLVKPWLAPVFEHHPAIDRLLCFEDPGRHQGVRGKLRLARELRAGRFDLAVLIQNAIEAAIITRLAGIPRRLGYATDLRGPLLTHPVPRWSEDKQRHQIDYYLTFLKRAGIPAVSREPRLVVTPAEARTAQARLQELFPENFGPVIGLNPGAAFGSAKRWMPEHFAETAHRLHQEVPCRVLIFGSPGETILGNQVAARIQAPVVNLCGRTTLREAMALIGQCRLLITNDSGLMHVAAALQTPLVAIFGPTNAVTTAPVGPRSRIVRAPVACSPCMRPECPTDHRCMTGVQVADVYAQARPWLEDLG